MLFTCDLVCLSHLRWDFVYQCPHHLLSRFARLARVCFVEEPISLLEESEQEWGRLGGCLHRLDA